MSFFSLYIHHTYLLVLMCNFVSCLLDTNECAVDSTLCGSGGTCMNIDNGNFYSCDCNDGFEENGASVSDGSLTCVGMFHLTVTSLVDVYTYTSKYLISKANCYNFLLKSAVQNSLY